VLPGVLQRPAAAAGIDMKITQIKWMASAVILLALAACGPGNPWPDIPGGAIGDRSVVLIGDSLEVQMGPELGHTLAWYGMNATVTNDAVGGTGLLDDNLQSRVDSDLDAAPPHSIIVYEWYGNCFFLAAGCAYYGSPQFYSDWETSMRNLIADARSRGDTVVWVTLPPSGDPNGQSLQLNDIYARVCAQLGVQRADWFTALSDTGGNYQEWLSYADVFSDPAWHHVRDPDGIHLLPDGAERAATWTAQAIRAVWTS